MNPANLLIIQGGGPSPVFNATLAGVLREAKSNPIISKIFGSINGIGSLARGELRELSHLQEAELEAIERRPGAILGSSRFEPKDNVEPQLAAALLPGVPEQAYDACLWTLHS
jgi:6-phosphofructokinase